MRSFLSWYGQATATLRDAARRQRATEREMGHQTPVESLSIDWDAWHAAQAETETDNPGPSKV